MSKRISDEDIERLFRHKADEGDYDYLPEAWERMEVLLDTRKKRRRLMIFWWTLFAGLVTTALIFAYMRFYPKEATTRSHPNIEFAEETPVETGADVSNADVTNLSQINDNEEDVLTINGLEQQIEVELEKSRDFMAKKTDTSSKPLTQIGTKQPSKRKPGKSDSGQAGNATNNELHSLNESHEDLAVENSINQSHVDFQERGIAHADILPHKMPQLIFGEADLPEIAMLTVPVFDEKPEWSRTWILSVQAGTRASATPSFGLQAYDGTIGLGFTGFLTKRIAFGLGAAYTNDQYAASPDDYHVPKGTWTYGIKPIRTEATCGILEVNLSTSFYFRPVNQNGIFAGFSTSNSFMARENYVYTYENPNPNLIQSWSGSFANRHYFNNIGIHAGYLYHLPKGVALSLSPYYNVPLKQIGQVGVWLRSAGVNLGVQYQLGIR